MVGEVTEWAEEVLERPNLVHRGLREIAWDEPSIQAFAAHVAELRSSPLPRSSVVARIRELLGRRKIEIEEVTTEVVQVPLYRFEAPPVLGAKVEYSEGRSHVEGSGWSLKVFGVGVGDTTSVEVTRSHTFVAADGTCKQVYVPVTMRVSRVATYDKDQLIGRGYQAQVVSPKESGDPLLQRRGCRSIARPDQQPGEYHDVLDLALAGDTSGVVHRDRRSWVTDVAREVSVHLGKLADVSALVRVTRTRRLELAFELPAGYDYRAYLGNGFTWWERPAGRPVGGRRRAAALR